MRSSLSRACVTALVVCGAACAGDAALGAAKIRAVEREVEAEMSRHQIPGMGVAIAEDLRLAWTRGFGLADVEDKAPLTASTLCRIASISKPVTATGVMQLAERGKLDLDAPIQRYVPSFPLKPWPLTARELLSHLGCIRHYQSFDEVYSTRHYLDLLEPLKIFSGEPLLCEPGTEFHYSTYAYTLLGAALEAASGMRFAEYLDRNIFQRAGMEHSRVDDNSAEAPHRARGYRRKPGGGVELCGRFDASNKLPGGGITSTAEDLVRFVLALENGRLVKSRTRDAMFTPARKADGRTVPYGLGWYLYERNGERWIGHSGAQPGASTYLLACPSRGFAAALLANLEEVDLGPLAVRIGEIVGGPSH